jgi:hypothetical protein
MINAWSKNSRDPGGNRNRLIHNVSFDNSIGPSSIKSNYDNKDLKLYGGDITIKDNAITQTSFFQPKYQKKLKL